MSQNDNDYKKIGENSENNILQEGWLSPTERASVSAITLRHILASPGYASGTIAVNVTWIKTGFNAGQTHSSIYPSTSDIFINGNEN